MKTTSRLPWYSHATLFIICALLCFWIPITSVFFFLGTIVMQIYWDVSPFISWSMGFAIIWALAYLIVYVRIFIKNNRNNLLVT